MGYWHTSNTDPSYPYPSYSVLNSDKSICSASKRPDASMRRPLVDFANSDSVFSSTDYSIFPDLLMFPAVAGAAVPIYNIPELEAESLSLILSRATIAAIFLGEYKAAFTSLVITLLFRKRQDME